MDEQEFRRLSASEGLDRLRGDFAEVKPDVDALRPEDFPGPVAEAVFWDNRAIAAIQGPVGSGKTTTVLKSRLRRAKMVPRSLRNDETFGDRFYKLLVIRATYRQLWSTTIPDFLGVYPKHLGEWSGGRGGPVTFVMEFEDGVTKSDTDDRPSVIHFTVEFMAFGDDIVGSLRGYQATDIWLHEMDTNPEDVLINAITRINRYPARSMFDGYPDELRDYGQIVGDMNAPERDNYCFRMFHDPAAMAETLKTVNKTLPPGTKPIEIGFHLQPGYGEPGCENLHNLAPGYYPTQIATMTLAGRGDMIDRMVRNKVTWMRIGEPVFKREFNRTIHVAPGKLEPWPGVPLRIGLDQGFIGAAVIAQFRPPMHWQILGVVFFPKERLMAKEFGRRLREYLDEHFPGLPIEAGWGDMAGEHGSSTAADENHTWNLLVGQSADMVIRPQRVGTNRIQPRLEAVRAPLEYIRGGRPGLIICPELCEPLIAGFTARYVWADEIDKSGDRRKVPNKRIAEANVMDALEYLLLSEHLANGLSPVPDTPNQLGHNGGPPLDDTGGLITGFDVLDPYGGL